jgi:rod shape-determining protein MreC
MVALSSDSRPIIGQGPPLLARLFFLGVISIVVMVFDHRNHYMDTARDWLTASLTPLNTAIQAPIRLWDWLTGNFVEREDLQKQNTDLRDKLRVANLQLLRFESLVEENRRLRAIRDASKGITQRTLIADIMQVDIDPVRHRVLIDKGIDEQVYKGQPVMDDNGIFGQITRAGRFTSEVILITDAAHAIPVQVNRNGIRSIAVGSGELNKLTLPFLTTEVDIRRNDLLVSSGIGGIFPAGYPVARVTRVERNPSETFATVEAKPLAALDRARQVLLLWTDQAGAQPPQVDLPPDAKAPRSAAGAPASTSETARSDAGGPPPPAGTPAGTRSAPNEPAAAADRANPAPPATNPPGPTPGPTTP